MYFELFAICIALHILFPNTTMLILPHILIALALMGVVHAFPTGTKEPVDPWEIVLDVGRAARAGGVWKFTVEEDSWLVPERWRLPSPGQDQHAYFTSLAWRFSQRFNRQVPIGDLVDRIDRLT